MLSIGEFSKICKVSTKTLRYYAKIGLILPEEIDAQNGYRYYTIEQLKTMLLINRLKTYGFTLEEIKRMITLDASQNHVLTENFMKKKQEIKRQREKVDQLLKQMDVDLMNIEQGKSIMSYMLAIDVEQVEVKAMNLLSIRTMLQENEIANAYGECFGRLLKRISEEKLHVVSAPMVLFHSSEYTPKGLDIEFAIPIRDFVKGAREFHPGLCLKTVLYGAYSQLPSIYAKQIEWAQQNAYECNDALFEVYVVDPLDAKHESDLVTEVYYPVKKKENNTERKG